MCTGIAIVLSEFPSDLLIGLGSRLYVREGRQEIQFHWWQEPLLLPVRWAGSLRLCRWGNRNRRSRLPFGGWLSREQIEAGIVAGTEQGIIPANLGYDKGTWFLISEGIQAVVLPDIPDGPVVYILTEPASNYYKNMAEQSSMMPVFVNQVI
jgi:hypothetical protein